jgi:glycosyltransferase involved in cell wall biosynthesis
MLRRGQYDGDMASVTFVITDLQRGGSPLMLAELAPGLRQCGWQVEVVSIAREGEVAGILRERGVTVTSLEARGNKDVRVVGRLARHVKTRRPDVVVSILVHANLLVALALPWVGPRQFAWVQSIHTVQEKPRWHWTVQGLISRHADAVVAPARAVIEKMRQHGRLPEARVIPNGIDVRRFYEARAVEAVPWPKGARVVGYVGRFDPVKRLEVLVEAMRELEGWHLALVGYGELEAKLRGLARNVEVGERVHVVGRTTEPERWYKAFDVFCSLSGAEGYGLTLAEATAAGVAVVACDTAVVRETVEAAGWVGTEAGAGEVSRAILGVVERGKKDRMSLPELKKRYSLERMVEAYASLLREANAWKRP